MRHSALDRDLLSFGVELLEARRLMSASAYAKIVTPTPAEPIGQIVCIDPLPVDPIVTDDPGIPIVPDPSTSDQPDWTSIDVQGTPDSVARRDGHFEINFGSFTPTLPADQYSITIDWGDNNTSTASLVPNPDGTLNIIGSHNYTAQGQYEVGVDIEGNDGSWGSTYTNVLANADTLTVTQSPDLYSYKGDDGTDTYLGSFYDIDHPGGDGSQYTVLIKWGDGTTTAGRISPNDAQGYDITGDHNYADVGTYAVSFTVTRTSDGAAVIANGTSQVDTMPDLSGWAYPDSPVSDPSGGGIATEPFISFDTTFASVPTNVKSTHVFEAQGSSAASASLQHSVVIDPVVTAAVRPSLPTPMGTFNTTHRIKEMEDLNGSADDSDSLVN